MNIHRITIETTPDAVPAAEALYRDALGLADRVGVRATAEPSIGFRGFAPSLIFVQPGDVDAAVERALAAGAKIIKPVAKSLWGYGGSFLAPDGTAWQIASANKTATAPATGEVERLVLLLGVDSVKASKRFYQEQGLTVAKSFPSYVEFDSGDVKLALYKRASLAKQVGIDPSGTGAHRLAVVADEAFTDPDGYSWLAAESTVSAG
ncbi:VOC family protein [Microbacterium azadirachtae]|uniref:Glyoxalase-like domain protein n=1 Tax=Microbacterium azadirachtae TaxID=582680 RepID=A0A0F0LR76_9MICO|nr:VOC family protein [Microbacterium azadirachtae]KJL34755.1 Glyoxalase-like domain protein [Microbacterium azadirachtae]